MSTSLLCQAEAFKAPPHPIDPLAVHTVLHTVSSKLAYSCGPDWTISALAGACCSTELQLRLRSAADRSCCFCHKFCSVHLWSDATTLAPTLAPRSPSPWLRHQAMLFNIHKPAYCMNSPAAARQRRVQRWLLVVSGGDKAEGLQAIEPREPKHARRAGNAYPPALACAGHPQPPVAAAFSKGSTRHHQAASRLIIRPNKSATKCGHKHPQRVYQNIRIAVTISMTAPRATPSAFGARTLNMHRHRDCTSLCVSPCPSQRRSFYTGLCIVIHH